MTIRIAFLALAACLGLAAEPAWGAPVPARAPAAEARAELSLSRDQVTVRGDQVRLGDLFTNTGERAAIAVEAAPPPGGQAVYDVHRLAAIARAHGLTWQARSWAERVVVDRAAQTIEAEQVMQALRAALQRETRGTGPFEIDVPHRDLSLVLPLGRPATVAIESLRYNPTTGQFSAVAAAAGGDPQARLNLAGRVHRLVEVPTLNRRMAPGDIIGKADIAWISLRSDRVSANAITDAEKLIGATPTRAAAPGRILMNGDVRPPKIVTKGSIVTMMLQTPYMMLTTKGRALEDGALGEVIRVMNTRSKTVIEGEVGAAGTVHVSPTLVPSAAALPADRRTRR